MELGPRINGSGARSFFVSVHRSFQYASQYTVLGINNMK